jgi:Na+-driven multidrug efflux pump
MSAYTDVVVIKEYAMTAFVCFCIALLFNWTFSQLSGSIKAVGAQGVASIGSLLGIMLVEFPLSYYFGV